MTREIDAIYEGGVFKPVVPIALPEHQRVRVIVEHEAEAKPQPPLPMDSFRETPNLDKLAAEQGVKPFRSVEELGGGFWPEDEDIDEFIATIRQWRQEGTKR